MPKVSLHFIIVGASVAGLSAAYGLASAGHRVTVLEKCKRGTPKHGSIRCPPNMAKLFIDHPQARKVLLQRAVKCRSITFKDGTGGQDCHIIGGMQFFKQLMGEFQADFYIVTYQEMNDMLLKICDVPGITIRYGKEVNRIERTANGVVAFMSNGNAVHGDVLVAADGRYSSLREAISEEESTLTSEIHGGQFRLPLSKLAKHPELSFIDKNGRDQWTVYSLPGIFMTTSVHPSTDEVHVGVAFTSSYWSENEDNPVNHPMMDPKLKTLLRLGRDQWKPQSYKCYETEEWVGLGSRAVIIGEAAHPSAVHGTYNTSMAAEDGAVLGHLFSHIQSPNQIPFFLNAFQEIRQPRCNKTAVDEHLGYCLVAMPAGPDRDARDAVFPKLTDSNECDMSNEYLALLWGAYIERYNYNCKEAADEWWVVWGNKMQEYA
ncbi:hypothetical protein DL96DRAFT_204022 [Flagelloscypha sp. PMI_526]|nr:hypothetical protein DL96DRAFT_204022 [Flagelloscypha sp. PMI_526]